MKTNLLTPKPSNWIIEQVNSLKKNSKINILDFASGSGRHCVNLADRNVSITAIDKDKGKLDTYTKFKNINTICFDLENKDQWPLEKSFFDIIIVTNYLYRPKIKELGSYLKEEGFLFYETFAVGNEKYGRPTNPSYLLKHRELISTFKTKFEVRYYFHGKIIKDKISVIQRCSLQKKRLPNVGSP